MIQRRDLVPVILTNPDAMMEIIQVLCGKLRVTSALIEDGLNENAGPHRPPADCYGWLTSMAAIPKKGSSSICG